MRPRSKRKTRLRRWERYLQLASDAGSIAMDLRDQPTRLDWLGVGLRALGLGLRLRGEARAATARDPWAYFEEPGLDKQWLEVPEEFSRTVVEHATDVVVDEDYWDGADDGARICRGVIGAEEVAWIAEGDHILDGPYVRAARERETFAALGDRVWKRVGGRHCVYGAGGLVLEPLDCAGILPTAQMIALEARLGRFLDDGVSRSCLMLGPPGTGKSMAIRWLARRLGVTSVRIDLSVLAQFHGSYGEQQIVASLDTVLKLLRPEALILDDLDRIVVNAPILAFLELAARTCRFTLASANCADKLIGAALRPGRFDEIIRVDRLDPDVLRQLLGAADQDLFDRLAPLPAAYVAEFLKRRNVLGRDVAIAELGEHEARRELVDAATGRGR